MFGANIDRHAARDLELYIDNDAALYRQRQSIEENLRKKIAKGTYDHSKAPKLWMYLVDEGARKYVKEFGGEVRTMFPKALRESVARTYAAHFYRTRGVDGLGLIPGVGFGTVAAGVIGYLIGKRSV